MCGIAYSEIMKSQSFSMNKYLIRLGDVCPTMEAMKWQRIENILDAYGVRPMIGSYTG